MGKHSPAPVAPPPVKGPSSGSHRAVVAERPVKRPRKKKAFGPRLLATLRRWKDWWWEPQEKMADWPDWMVVAGVFASLIVGVLGGMAVFLWWLGGTL